MKLSIRTRLIWINLLVTTTILWLTLSFFSTAYIQRKDATFLIDAVNQNDQLLEAVYRFATERNRYVSMLGENQPQDHYAFDDLIEYTSTTHVLVDDLRFVKGNMLQHHALTKQFVYPADFLSDRLNELDDHREILAVYQEYANQQLRLEKSARDKNINSILFEAYSDTIELLMQINTYIQIQPEIKITGFTDLELLRKLVLENSRLSLLQTGLLTSALTNSLPYGQDLKNRLLIIEAALLQSRTGINRYNHKNLHDEHIRREIESVFTYNDFNYAMAKSRLEGSLLEPALAYMDTNQWKSVVNRQIDNLWALSKAINLEQQNLAQNSHDQASRHLLIDAAIVMVCLLIALISYGITKKIRHQAYHDEFTGLPNRSLFKSHLSLITTTLQSTERLAVIYLDINKLKSINDTFGQDIGDEYIALTSQRLIEQCDDEHFLARMGGDEFAIALRTSADDVQITALANRLIEHISQETNIRGITIRSSASAGIAIFNEDGLIVDELIRMANVALFHAKSDGKARVIRYDGDLAGRYHQRVQTEIELKKALELNQLELHYQPKTSVNVGTAQHLEALLRWNHPTRGKVPPSEFIPIAEAANLLDKIGSWVLDETCRQIATWKQFGLTNLTVAVNISAKQFQDDNFIATVLEALDRHQIDHHQLELEITESIVMENIDRVIDMLSELKRLGITIAIDDFGTGYSSLQYLQSLPLNTIKIDRAFVSELDSGEASTSLVNTIVQLAKHLGLQTVAEGVETPEQDKKIRSLGVDFIQGYYYSKPIAASEVPAALSRIALSSGIPRAA